MRRAVPLTRSDFQFAEMPNVVDGNQCHTYGLSFWLSFQGSGCRFYDPYSFRSFYMAEFGMCEGLAPGNAAAQIQAYAECKKIAPIMVNGDYYPLTPYSLTNNVWMAWQFDWPDTGQGCVQAFRRSKCAEPVKSYRLNGLNPAACYEVTNFDVKGSMRIFGSELLEKGLTIEIHDQPGSAIIFYKEIEMPAQKHP
jgi:alpha-galactosidase